MKKIKLEQLYVYSVSIIILTLSSLFFYWSVVPYTPIKFNAPYKTEKTLYQQGDETYYIVNYCKYTNIMPTVSKHFVDGLIFNAGDTAARLSPGCRTQAIEIQIPRTLPPGKYHLEITLNYQVNPIREIIMTNKSNTFIVTRAADGAYGDLTNNGITPELIKE